MPSYVVTGASRGIGVEFIRQLSADANNTVFAVIRNPKTADELLKLDKERTNVHVLTADVSKPADLKKAAEQVGRVTGGTLDYLINNAAYVPHDRIEYTLDEYAAKGEEDLLEKDMEENYKTNVLGVIHSTNAFLPLLKEASKKHTVKVITISTGVAGSEFTLATGLAGHAPYSISKAATNLVVAKYAARFRDEPFVFLALSPGLVNTSTEPPTPEVLEKVVAMIKAFKKAAPDWDGQFITPEQSVKSMLPIIERWERKDTGAFVSHHGNKSWL